MSEKKHTPGPWHGEDLPEGSRPVISDARGRAICQVSGRNSVANHAFILQATNVHDEPVAALTFAAKQLKHNTPDDCWATGPMTGDVINDLIACPGCEALRRIDAALLKSQSNEGG